METALLLFLLAGASHGTETTCDVRQDGAQCYAAEFGTVYLQLTDKLSRYEHELVGNTRNLVFKRKDEKVVYYDKNGRTLNDGLLEFDTKNGSLRISKIGKEYSDNYTLKTTNTSNGETSNHALQLSVEAPVSSPSLVFSECLPQGGMRMSCSCDGDSPRYSWTLDGQALNDSRVSHDEERSSLTLERGVLGRLTCTIKNHISDVTVNLDVSNCNGTIYVNCTSNGTEVSHWVSPTGPNLCTSSTTTKPILQTESTTQAISDVMVISAGSLAAGLVLAVLLGVCFMLSRKRTAAPAAPPEDADEVTYADVRFMKKGPEEQKTKPAALEVEYGQVMIRPRY